MGSLLALVCTFAALLRWSTTLFSYSGEGTLPMHGDYEAQRHWMEITVNLPINEWYMNSNDNNLTYWGMDYPPLTAYHSYLCGLVATWIDPRFVALKDSHGFESYEHKLFMRYTAFIADFAVFVPAIVWYFYWRAIRCYKGLHVIRHVDSMILLALTYPGLILIDHGHFQYNSVSLGLALLAVISAGKHWDIIGTVLFCSALSYKQMELYHALPFFFYFLGQSVAQTSHLNKFLSVYKLSIAVIMSFAIMWYPFFTCRGLFFQLLYRLFPLARGVFEDKVANFWCTINVIFKVKQLFDNATMAKVCLCTTALFSLPSGIHVLRKPWIHSFLYSLLNISLVFFLFSFQVHEKSILLAALPAILLLHDDPLPIFWFLLITVFSMLPLFIKDNLVIPFIGLTVVYCVTMLISSHFMVCDISINAKQVASTDRLKTSFNNKIVFWVFIASISGCVILTIANVCLSPPVRYPDLFPFLVAFYSCGHFMLFLIYFHYCQFNIKN